MTSPGNLKASVGQGEASARNEPTFWQLHAHYLVGAIFLLFTLMGLLSGTAVLPSRYGHGLRFDRDQDPTMYWITLAIDLGVGIAAFFYTPHSSWIFRVGSPPDPPMDDSYAGYKRPPQIIVHPNLPPLRPSDFYEPAFIRSLLLLVCVFGAMVTAAGLYQLVIGEVYFPNHGALDMANLHDDPQQFLMAMVPYGTTGLVTLGLGVFLYFWRPLRQVATGR